MPGKKCLFTELTPGYQPVYDLLEEDFEKAAELDQLMNEASDKGYAAKKDTGCTTRMKSDAKFLTHFKRSGLRVYATGMPMDNAYIDQLAEANGERKRGNPRDFIEYMLDRRNRHFVKVIQSHKECTKSIGIYGLAHIKSPERIRTEDVPDLLKNAGFKVRTGAINPCHTEDCEFKESYFDFVIETHSHPFKKKAQCPTLCWTQGPSSSLLEALCAPCAPR